MRIKVQSFLFIALAGFCGLLFVFLADKKREDSNCPKQTKELEVEIAKINGREMVCINRFPLFDIFVSAILSNRQERGEIQPISILVSRDVDQKRALKFLEEANGYGFTNFTIQFEVDHLEEVILSDLKSCQFEVDHLEEVILSDLKSCGNPPEYED